MIRNNNANITFVFSSVIIGIISFFLILNVFITNSDRVTPLVDDFQCNSFLKGKEISKLGLGFFLYEVNNKCGGKEKLEVNIENKEKLFDKVADSMDRCYFRYGGGDVDFLSNFDTTGNWCFTCAKFNYEEESNSVIKYDDFIEWLKSNPKKKKPEDEFYINKIKIDSKNFEEKELIDIKKEYSEILKDNKIEMESDPSLNKILSVLSERINYLDDLDNKKFDTDDDFYVVFRYDRLEMAFDDKIDQATSYATYGALTGVGISILAEIAIEAALFGSIGAGAGAVFGLGVGAIPGGFIGTVVGATKGAYKGIKGVMMSTAKITRITRLSSKLKKMTKFSKSGNIGRVYTVGNKIKKLEVKLTDITTTIKNAKKLGYSTEYVNKLKNVEKLMQNLKIDDLASLEKGIIKNQKQIDNLEDIINSGGKTWKNWKGKDEFDLFEEAIFSVAEKNQLQKLQKLALDELDLLKKGEKIELPSIKDYLKIGLIVGTGTASGFFGSQMNFNFNQYVDIMTQEQYYRLCGTEPPKNFE